MPFFDDSDDPRRGRLRPLYGFVIVTLAVGASASLFTEPQIHTWYARLARPAIAPPNWVFAPVWTTLYVMMAVAAWRVWRVTGLRRAGAGGGSRQNAFNMEMIAWGLQLALNFAWSAIFFAAHRIGAALAEIVVLDIAILVTAILFWRRDRLAGLLLAPYLCWTLFATVLTHAFWRLNG